MWKILLAFLSQRFLLLLVALFSINFAAKLAPGQRLLPTPVLWQRFTGVVSDSPEVTTLTTLSQRPPSQAFRLTTNPMFWLGRLVLSVTPLSPLACLLLLSNLFSLLFLWELFSLLSRFALSEVAASAGVLAVLWVTSYELSLGSSLSLACWLTTLGIRSAVDGQWLLCGIGLAVLGLTEPLVLGLLPLICYLFWYFQRQFPVAQVARRAAFLLLPLLCVILWRWGAFRYTLLIVRSSAFYEIVGILQGHESVKAILSGGNLTQTISLAFFLIGGIAACIVNHTTLHRIIPLYLLIVVLAFSTYATLASRLILAAVCLEGITAIAAGPLIRVVQLGLLGLSVGEVFSLFH